MGEVLVVLAAVLTGLLGVVRGRPVGSRRGAVLGASRGRPVGSRRGAVLGASRGRSAGSRRGGVLGASRGRPVGAGRVGAGGMVGVTRGTRVPAGGRVVTVPTDLRGPTGAGASRGSGVGGRLATHGPRGPRRLRRGRAVDLVGVLHDTAARLRSGAPPASAWSDVLARPGVGDVPTVEDLVGPGAARRGEDAARARAVVAAARLATDLGAPLADVLESVAGAVAADEEHDADVAAALAGPRATARVLLALPAAGVLMGMLLGADPLGVMTRGGAGTGCALLGAAALLVGRWWTGRLLVRTVDAGRLRT